MSSEELVVFAKNRTEMIESQNQLIGWTNLRLGEAAANIADVRQNIDIAVAEGWKTDGWNRQERIARKKVEYYQKIHAALSAGYVIVPDMPVDIFAVRTNRAYPIKNYSETTSQWDNVENRLQRSERLPIGEGRHVDSEPVTTQDKWTENNPNDASKSIVKYGHYASDFNEADFPIKSVKPVILTETSKALALKIFDEIGCNPGRPGWSPHRAQNRVGVDPMVIGRVIWKSPDQWGGGGKYVSFLITWWLDASDLKV